MPINVKLLSFMIFVCLFVGLMFYVRVNSYGYGRLTIPNFFLGPGQDRTHDSWICNPISYWLC